MGVVAPGEIRCRNRAATAAAAASSRLEVTTKASRPAPPPWPGRQAVAQQAPQQGPATMTPKNGKMAGSDRAAFVLHLATFPGRGFLPEGDFRRRCVRLSIPARQQNAGEVPLAKAWPGAVDDAGGSNVEDGSSSFWPLRAHAPVVPWRRRSACRRPPHAPDLPGHCRRVGKGGNVLRRVVGTIAFPPPESHGAVP